MKRTLLAGLPLLGAMVLLTGCTTRIGDFTVLSTKNIPCTFAAKGPGEGEDIQRFILIIPTQGPPNLKEAVDRTIESQPGGDMLANAKVYFCNWTAILYGEYGFSVKGDVVSSRSLAR